jgi:2-amino-4-hydroxy-6-hydroxymethyldihydropteridine diphosphokinase
MWFAWRIATAASEPRESVVYLGLGSNIGDRQGNLAAALAALREIVTIDRVSSVYASEPVGHTEQPEFWNLAVRARTALTPATLLDAVKRVEKRLGRTPTFRFGPRLIDIDILLWDNQTIHSGTVEVPHPRMMDRAFVLEPLVELDADLHHPVTREKLADRLESGTFEHITRLFEGDELMEGRP